MELPSMQPFPKQHCRGWTCGVNHLERYTEEWAGRHTRIHLCSIDSNGSVLSGFLVSCPLLQELLRISGVQQSNSPAVGLEHGEACSLIREAADQFQQQRVHTLLRAWNHQLPQWGLLSP